MQRLTSAWFEFNGVSSASKNIRLVSMPRRIVPAERGEKIVVPGRSGVLWIGENGARDSMQIDVQCESIDGYTPEVINDWLLSKTALLRFSDEPGYAYKARCISQIARESKFISFDKQIFTVTFDCQPYRYIHPAPAAQTVATSGGTITNGGTKPSLPKVTITATGDYTVTINGTPVQVTGGSVIIDSELMECFNADGATLANSRVTLADYPTLSVGTNSITWSGSVTSVAVLPRSRSL